MHLLSYNDKLNKLWNIERYLIQKKANRVPRNKKLSTKSQKSTKAGTEAKLSKRAPEHKRM